MPSETPFLMNPDRARWNERYRIDNAPRRVHASLKQYAHLLKPGRILDLAGGIGQNALWLMQHTPQLPNSRAIVADISDEALRQASPQLARVLCDASALPFAPHSFDTLICTRFFDARVRFEEMLTRGGTVFFETYTTADTKYNPAFNPAHRFDLSSIPHIFSDLEILHLQETDDGRRVFVTIVARRN